jgi:predicted ATPase/DNA-binding XRE family transcriptional regulator
MEDEISFGSWLRKQRKSLDLSQKTFASQVGCAEVTLRRIEAGTLKPSRELAGILFEKIGIPQSERPQWFSFARGLSGFPPQFLPLVTRQFTNLPEPLTSFIGRQREQADVIRLISIHRLVTLTGSGGVGKTRLSIKVGQHCLGIYPDGVWLVELAPILAPELVPRMVAIAIGLRDEPQRSVMGMLSDYLRGKKMLLILDNCEHLVDACSQLANSLLKRCSSLKVLATSREPLGMLGEAAYRVPSLEVPDTKQSLVKLRQNESVCLFVERAQLARTDFYVKSENVSFVVEICNQLDGIPLAIELAAARISTFSVEQIARQLQRSCDFLTVGNRTALPRHQTLQAAIDWSYDLLSPTEKSVFQRLSVFVNGWTLDAAAAICVDANITSEDVLNVLNHLTNKSLIITEKRSKAMHYRMLEAMRQYANKKLIEAGENVTFRNRHLEYFLDLVETVEPHLIRPEQLEWLPLLDADYDNLRTALEWSLIIELPEAALRLCAALGRFWLIRCYWLEGSKWLEKALTKSTQNSSNFEKTVRVRALYQQAELANQLDDLEHMKNYSELSLALAYESSDKRDISIARFYVGYSLIRHGNNNQACLLIEQSLAYFRESNDFYWQAYCFQLLGELLETQGQLKATERIMQDLTLAQTAGERLILAEALWNYSKWLYTSNNIDEAIKYAKEVDVLFEEIGSKQSLTSNLFAEIAWTNGAHRKARSYYLEMEKRYNMLGERNLRSMMLANLGLLAVEQGDLSQGKTYSEQALTIARELNNKDEIAMRLAELGINYYLEGNVEKCRQSLRASIATVKIYGTYLTKRHILLLIVKYWEMKDMVNLAYIIGALDASRGEGLRQITPLNMLYYNRAEIKARQVLGDEIFSPTYAEGQKMSLDEGLDLVLKSVEEM